MKIHALPARVAGFLLVASMAVSCAKDSPAPLPVKRSMEVWLHRVNTTGKAQHFRDLYSGFELDVHYDTILADFIVKHNATDTSTLTLQVWLDSVRDPAGLGYWLDFKNLTSLNSHAALAELTRIRQEFGLVHHVIVVESENAGALPPFDTLNFRISYYTPWFDPAGITGEQEEAWMQDIQSKTGANGIETISGYYFQYGMMDKWFHGMNKLLWYLDSFDPAVRDSIITVTKKDPSVEVLLVGEDYL